MKVFVTYHDYSDEGCSEPIGVFLTEAAAEATRPKDDWGHFTVVEFEVDEEKATPK